MKICRDVRGTYMKEQEIVYAINFADENFEKARKWNTKTAYKHGADIVCEYKLQDIDEEFYKKNKSILQQKRGCGYWLWKPYFIYKTLLNANDNDWIVYADSGLYYRRNIKSYIVEIERDNIEFLTCITKFIEKAFTKMDVFVDLNCNTQEYTDSKQMAGGAIIVKNTPQNRKIIKEWLDNAQNYHWITDEPNRNNSSNYPEFIEHRHDQSLFSLLCKKYNIAYREDLFLDMAYPNKSRALLVYHHSNSRNIFEAYISTIGRVIKLICESLKQR